MTLDVPIRLYSDLHHLTWPHLPSFSLPLRPMRWKGSSEALSAAFQLLCRCFCLEGINTTLTSITSSSEWNWDAIIKLNKISFGEKNWMNPQKHVFFVFWGLCILLFVVQMTLLENIHRLIFFRDKKNWPDSSLMNAGNPVLGYMTQTFWYKYNVFT